MATCYEAHGDGIWVARVCLDLARVCLSEGRAQEASALTSELVAKLGALVTAPEELAALKAVGRAATPAAAVTGEHLDRAEQSLKRLEWDRRASRALHLAL